jgi:signal transduction histidine kinase
MRKIGFIIDLFSSYMENMMNYIGHLIVSSNINDKDYSNIAKILKDIEYNLDKKHKDMLVSAMFDFITPEGNTVASTLHGLINPPKKVQSNRRKYIELCKKYTWKMFIDIADIGITVSERIIPLAMGISDKDGKFLGYVTSGINVEKFKNRLSKIINNDYYSFIILNNDLDYILYSGEEKDVSKEDRRNIKLNLDYLKNKKEVFGTLDETMFLDGTEYIFYTKANDYPFTIIVGIKRKDIFNLKDLEKKIVDLEKDGDYHQMFLFTLLYMFQDKIINPIISTRPHYSNFEIPKVFSTKINDLFLALEQMEGFMEIKIQKEVAEEAKKVKEKFFNMVLHDLRNPASIINGILSLVENDGIESKDAFLMIKSATLKIMNIVNGLQTVNKIEGSKFKLNKKKVDIDNIIDVSLEPFKFDIDTKGLYFKKDIKIKDHYIFADKQLMIRILTNLISNAIKYTSKGGITITVYEDKGDKVISVKDTGTGMKKEIISRVMKDLYPKEEDTLLFGLPVIKKFIERHSGKLEVKSELGKGSEIIMRFKE